MAQIKEIFDPLFDELNAAIERQRELHTSAFGKDNAKEIVTRAEDNRQKLNCWDSLLKDIKTEMIESGLFAIDKRDSECKSLKAVQKVNSNICSPNTRPVSVTVLGHYKPVRYWKDILLFVCKILYEQQPHRFAEIENEPTLQGRNKPYISNNKNSLRKPHIIEGSPYFVEINLSQVYCIKIALLLMRFFGYNRSDITIEEEPKVSCSHGTWPL